MPDPDARSNPLPWLLPAVAVCVLGLAFWLWPRADVAPPDRGQGALHDATQHDGTLGDGTLGEGPADHTPAGAADGPDGGPTTDAGLERTEAFERVRPQDAAAFAQGLRGLVIDAAGRSLGGVPVHLIESASNDPLMLPLMRQQQHFLAPVASTETAADGSFALGLEVVQDKVYDVFVLSSTHATARLGGLRLLPGSWHELGAITLDPGTTIRGRVTVQGQPAIPVPHAVVTVETGEAFADAALQALPQEQGALFAHVDSGGYYELPHAPARGVVRVSAVAPGFARVTARDVEMQPGERAPGEPLVLDFELPTGRTLVGDVRSADDRPLAGARVEAWPKERSEAPLIAFTDERGAFALHGLRTTDYRVRATAAGHEPCEVAQVDFGRPLALQLAERDRVQVVVRTERGRVLRDYRLQLRRFFPSDRAAPLDAAALQTGAIGAVPEVRAHHVRLTSDREHAELLGVPQGTFVCAVDAEGFATSLSLPFRCGPEHRDEASRTVEVVVTRGVTLRGRVLDEAGAPLAGAVVTSQRAGTQPDNALFRVFGQAVPSKATQRKVTTDADGWFRLERLALADYQLQVAHPDACRAFARDLSFAAEAERTLPPITLPRGALVRGRATHDGRVAAQMKVVLSTPADVAATDSLRLETITDADGHYAFPRRVPPGDYQLRASVVGQQAPDAEIFQQLLQLQRSSTTFSVLPGQDAVDIDYDLPSAN